LDYLEASVIAKEALEELLSRLNWMAIKPSVILDIGCGMAEGAGRLREHYPDATVIALDCSFAMLEKAQYSHRICANGETLPLPDQSVNFIFANMLLPWHRDHQALLREWRRVLRPDGLLLFSALGVDTLRELQSLVDPHHMPVLQDMHDVGDGLLAAGFSDPVLDVNYYTTTYRSKDKLAFELHASGMLAVELTEAEKEKIQSDVTYEVIYAHAFAPQPTENVPGEFSVPLSQLRQEISFHRR
jgi:malonyl-CoA O-methyltransferase